MFVKNIDLIIDKSSLSYFYFYNTSVNFYRKIKS